MIDVLDLIFLGMGAIAVYIIWEQQQMLKTLAVYQKGLLEVMAKHNSLSDAFIELSMELEYEEETTDA
tara:strand:- start:409 stop:612 length:204 start_codon:yes stop_codon:yes gene_type:complete